jgi:hypothetical protein
MNIITIEQYKRKPVIITGGRAFSDKAMMTKVLAALDPAAVAHGAAEGADTMAGKWARERGRPVIEVPANWKFYDNAAGAIRNRWMLAWIASHDLRWYILAFPGGNGTASMIREAQKAEITVLDAADIAKVLRSTLHAY